MGYIAYNFIISNENNQLIKLAEGYIKEIERHIGFNLKEECRTQKEYYILNSYHPLFLDDSIMIDISENNPISKCHNEVEAEIIRTKINKINNYTSIGVISTCPRHYLFGASLYVIAKEFLMSGGGIIFSSFSEFHEIFEEKDLEIFCKDAYIQDACKYSYEIAKQMNHLWRS